MPTLGPSHVQMSLVPVYELGLSLLVLFFHEKHDLGFFVVSPLVSQGCPHSFTKLEVMMENATVDPWRSARTAKALVQP